MKKETKKIIMIIVTVVVVAILVGLGIKYFREDTLSNDPSEYENGVLTQLIDADSFERLELTSNAQAFDEVNQAFKAVDEDGEIEGFVVFLSAKGYNGAIEVRLATDETGREVKAVSIGENTEEKGTAVGEAEFLNQFKEKYIPFRLAGAYMKEYEDIDKAMKDGTYRSEKKGYDENFTDFVEMEIKDGAIESVKWDGFNSDAKFKTELSETGEYKSEGTEPWHLQSKKVTDKLEEVQVPSAIVMDSEGFADGIKDVDINIKTFIELADDCVKNAQKAYKESPQETLIEAVSGATISSTAVINAINIGTKFIIDNFII